MDLDERWLPIVHSLRERELTIVSIQSRWRRQASPVWKNVADTDLMIEDAAPAFEFARIFASLDRQHGIAGILTDQDEVLAPVAEAARAAGIRFTDADAIAICRDKLRFRQFLSDASMNPRFCWIPKTADLREAVGKIGYPCVVKPVRGSGSRVCYPLYNDDHVQWYEEELAGLMPQLPLHMNWLLKGGLICEGWLEGPVVSAAVAATGLKVAVISCALHLKHDENPCTGFGSVSFDPARDDGLGQCAAMAERLVHELGLSFGLFDVEMILTEGGPKVLEVNARPMGGEMITALALRTQTDAYGFLVDLYCGTSVEMPLLLPDVATGIYKIVAKSAGVISESLDLDAIIGLLPAEVLLRNYRLCPATSVAPLEVLGRILVVGTDVQSQLVALDERTVAVGAAIGVELITATPSISSQLAPLARH
ncbi:acetyl-CoA carboxylase biotin carboxylase subunit family protein [Novosphingobium sp. ZW T3_23]|uniref:ATP-grasp domain-containing protein n=1 Tax=Novosphingobium sp. ZW T3_23 TaxID=3378084 RepID=UPI003854D8A3